MSAKRRAKEEVGLASQEAMEERLTVGLVVERAVLGTENEVIKLGRAKDGGVWFRDTVSGLTYRVMLNDDDTLMVAETRESKSRKSRVKEHAETHTTITCQEEGCEAEREIKIQDKFQVTRCAPCQKSYRAKKRAERAKVRRAEKRTARELEKLNEEPAQVEANAS